ncbi:response regulator [Piscinibacter sp. XHJ-5]|uniref:hybrid sensor histidine kinase/response regulator n=1 Tax=Piscinibacter sp. XHJ-5 TaxID=3037797 RepID=UPI00245316A1|nr:response regulator [Piscinibacter sp. XHJ-5]
MATEDDSFLRQLLATFQVEAEEHLGAMSSLLLALERSPPGEEVAGTIETLFREAHSLKGAARSVNLADIEQVCQALERVLAAMKRQELAPSPEFLDAFHRTLDGLSTLLAAHLGGATADPAAPVVLARSLDALLAPARGAAPLSPAARPASLAEPALAAAPSSETVRVATAKLESLMTQADELQAFKLGAEHLVAELHALGRTLEDRRRQIEKAARNARALRRVGAAAESNGRGRQLLSQVLDSAERETVLVKELADRVMQLERSADRDRRGLGQRVDRLQADMRQALMLPFSTLLVAMPKLVRDLAQAGGKDIELQMNGTSLEVDRRILEQLKTPLVHLIRNAVDHGIEPPLERQRRGKSPRGLIRIDIVPREGNRIELALSDDGAGIALAHVQTQAERMGLWKPGADATQTADLVFASGLSTSPILTDLSGHGLGLAIVREKIERLGGSVSLQLRSDEPGTRFSIVVPATLASFRGLLVSVAEQMFVLPSRHVERVVRAPGSAVQRGDGGDAVMLGSESLPLVPLAAALGLAPHPRRHTDRREPMLQLVVAASGERRVAFAVDEVIGDQEVLVKPLAPPLRRVRNIAGAIVLAGGRVVPLLNVADLVKMSSSPAARAPSEGGSELTRGRPRASLLLAEDSITSRERLKNILESAGYEVTTAADGMAALASLQSGHFDLLVSDVEMPRLDGFGLTERVRRDKRLAELPVVLVTALDSREDKERGVEVGANAYIAKSGFDQRRLLATIRALI